MATSLASHAALALPIVGIVLALADWWVRPPAAFGWALAIAVLLVMAFAEQVSRRAFRQSTGKADALHANTWITNSVVCGALMMVFALGTTLTSSFGIVDDLDLGKRVPMILTGIFLAAIGNVMPKMLPPLAQLGCDGVRVQNFQRLCGWTWALCGLTTVLSWLALPIDIASPVSMTVTAASVVLTLALLARLRQRRPPQSSPLTH